MPIVFDDALTTLAAVKTALDITASGEDARIEAYIDRASAVISMFCDRKFASTVYTAEIYNGTGHSSLWLNNWPIIAVASLYLDSTRTFGSDSLLSVWSGGTGDYVFHTGEEGQGLVERVNGGFSFGVRNIQITYTAGFATIPFAVAEAAIHLVAYYQTRAKKVAFIQQTETYAGGGTTTYTPREWPKEVRDLLEPWRKKRFVTYG
jgi:hypothetical protein